MSNSDQVERLTEFIVNAVDGAKSIDAPYHHIEFAPFFPAYLPANHRDHAAVVRLPADVGPQR
jgi:hypothetical protein